MGGNQQLSVGSGDGGDGLDGTGWYNGIMTFHAWAWAGVKALYKCSSIAVQV